jgi:hypothetical protein
VDCEEEEEEDDDHEESIEEKVGRDRIGISLLSYIPSWRKFSVLNPGKHRSRERLVLITVIPTGTVGFIDIPNSFSLFFQSNLWEQDFGFPFFANGVGNRSLSHQICTENQYIKIRRNLISYPACQTTLMISMWGGGEWSRFCLFIPFQLRQHKMRHRLFSLFYKSFTTINKQTGETLRVCPRS